jgi:hypothetical protein
MNRITLLVKGPHGGYRVSSLMNRLRTASGMLALMAGLGAVVAPLPVDAVTYVRCAVVSDQTVAVYGFDANGSPVLIPDATILAGGIYTDAGFFGTINAEDEIVNANNEIVGYVSYS